MAKIFVTFVCLKKTGKDRDISYPFRLIKFANEQKKNPEISFDKMHDKMIVVFDADIFEKRVENYGEILAMAEEQGDILAVTNPSFELFLLLHYENAYNELILPNLDEILVNEKEGNQTFIYQLLLAKSGMNCKKNSEIGKLAKSIDVAIAQERNLNQNPQLVHGRVSCNIGKVIEEIRNDTVSI